MLLFGADVFLLILFRVLACDRWWRSQCVVVFGLQFDAIIKMLSFMYLVIIGGDTRIVFTPSLPYRKLAEAERERERETQDDNDNDHEIGYV